MSDPLRQELLDIFTGRATGRYGLSAVNQLQHALQAAAFAKSRHCSPTPPCSPRCCTGHMIHGPGEDPAGRASTTCRAWAEGSSFGPAVASRSVFMSRPSAISAPSNPTISASSRPTPCAVSACSGPMSADEIAIFRRHPQHEEAVRLRRYDEAAKDPLATTPDFDHFLRHVPACRRA